MPESEVLSLINTVTVDEDLNSVSSLSDHTFDFLE